MMLIGTSLGGCLKSIAKGEVDSEDVLVIITRTASPTYEEFIKVIETYAEKGNHYATRSENYDMTGIDLDTLKEIGRDLWYNGKIHQPRLFNNYGGFVHADLARNWARDQLWLNIAPSPMSDDKTVVDAYEKYLVLRSLMK